MLNFVGEEPVLRCLWTDPKTGAKGYVIIDSLVTGVAAGGCRMRKGLTENEVTELAQTMTLKFSLYDLPIGGGKCGVDYPSDAPDADQVLTRFYQAVMPILKQTYMTGQDLGTREEQILKIFDDIGIPSLAAPAVYQWGLDENLGAKMAEAYRQPVNEQTFDLVIAGFGVSQCALEALDRKGVATNNAKAAVQGFGNVGGAAALDLYQAGVKVVGVSDIQGAVICEDGLDISKLIRERDIYGVIDRSKLPSNYRQTSGDELFDVESDIFIPAASSYTVDLERAKRLSSTIISEGANNGITKEAEDYFFQKKALVIPDFLANSAFALCLGAMIKGYVNCQADELLVYAAEKQRKLTSQLWDAFAQGKEPRPAVMEIAHNNLEKYKK